MMTVTIEPRFESWRKQARELLQRGIPPDRLLWCDGSQPAGLLCEEPAVYAEDTGCLPPVRVPADFLRLAERAAAHTDARRWDVLYRLSYRLTAGGERHLLKVASDADVRMCESWGRAVGRDIHKMHAFVRFRLIGVDEGTGREQFIAWFEPAYRIVRLAAPFFEKRFAGMDWSILTPDECVHWHQGMLTFSPGADRNEAPAADAHDDLWRSYYRSIFNPARIKVQAMKSEMPLKYWKNLPEAEIIQDLLANGEKRVKQMLETPERPVKPVPDNDYIRSLHERRNSS